MLRFTHITARAAAPSPSRRVIPVIIDALAFVLFLFAAWLVWMALPDGTAMAAQWAANGPAPDNCWSCVTVARPEFAPPALQARPARWFDLAAGLFVGLTGLLLITGMERLARGQRLIGRNPQPSAPRPAVRLTPLQSGLIILGTGAVGAMTVWFAATVMGMK